MAMRIRVIAVGLKPPAWVRDAARDYAERLPPELRLEWTEVRPDIRGPSGHPPAWMTAEAQRIREAIPNGATVVALDEHGDDLTSRGLATRLERWRDRSAPLAILIGGPDGLDPGLKREAHERIRLSSLTLPHALVRVVIAEQLFRAWTILSNHPYHRD
jgi:23S rRNA (pseudouridine1915-N3)-methyltransferase